MSISRTKWLTRITVQDTTATFDGATQNLFSHSAIYLNEDVTYLYASFSRVSIVY